MSFRILRRFLNLSASNSKSIQLRRFLKTTPSDSKAIHNGNGKLRDGSQCRDLITISLSRDFVMVHDASEPKLNPRRAAILMGTAVSGVFLVHESLSKAEAESLKKEILESLTTDEDDDDDDDDEVESWHERLEELKIREEKLEKEHKLLLEVLEELKRDKSIKDQ